MKKIILLIAIFFISYTNAQTILIVDNNVSVDTTPAHVFNTFAGAIAAAANGDTIYVQPSETTYGSITINKEVTIYGGGHTPELNNGRRAFFGNISITASNVKLSGIGVSANTSLSVTGTRSNITIENNMLFNIAISGGITDNVIIQGNIINNNLTLSSNAANSMNTTVVNNFFDTPSANGLSYLNSSTIFNNNIVVFNGVTTQSFINQPIDLVAQNNVFVFTSSFNGTNWEAGGTPTTFHNCLSYSYPGNTLALMNGIGNHDNINPIFTSIPANNPVFDVLNDYHIGSGSLGTDGNEVGIHNGFYDFDMRGYPTLLPYITEMTIQNNMLPAGTDLNVNLKANANKTN